MGKSNRRSKNRERLLVEGAGKNILGRKKAFKKKKMYAITISDTSLEREEGAPRNSEGDKTADRGEKKLKGGACL